MRLESVKIHQVGPFEDFEIDLSQYPAGSLIAVCGENGAGKSCFLESSIAGAMYRSMPTQGTLVGRARARDSFLEARIATGSGTWTIRHSLDAVSRKGEALVLDESGRPVLPDTKVSSYDAWAATAFPPPAVLYASVFAAQGQDRFLAANPAERKTILLRVLGIERLEALTERAREHMRGAKAAVDTLRARIADERARGGDPGSIEAEIAVLEDAAAGASKAVDEARRALDFARSGAPALELARREAETLRAKRGSLKARLAAKQSELDALNAKLANNRRVLAEADAIRSAETRSEALAVDIAQLKARISELASEVRAAASEAAAQHKMANDAFTAAKGARVRAEAARRRLADRAEVTAAAAAIPALDEVLRKAEAAHQSALEKQREVSGQRAADADERIVWLRDGMTQIVRMTGGSPVEIAGAALERDDAAVMRAAELPHLETAAAEVANAAMREVRAATHRLQTARVTAARGPELDAAQRDAEAAEEAARDAEERAKLHHHNASLDTARRDAAEATRETLASEHLALCGEAERLAPIAAKAGPLANAEGRLSELQPQHQAVASELSAIEEELQATPEPPAVPTPPDVADLELRSAAAEQAAKGASAAVAMAGARLNNAHRSAAAAAELEGQERAAVEELEDWTRLAAELGRDGLQALEIDAAGPELTELVNDLLRTCFGSRWSISIETTRTSADGKRQLEGCEVRVLDTVDGREDDGRHFSGGQRVILDEAMSLALTMLACRRTGLRGVTLVRDESGAALSEGNARAYVKMLRRAAELVDARHVLFVSHSREVIEMSDERIELAPRDYSGDEAAAAE